MSSDPGDNGNGKVTMVLLGYKIDQLTAAVSELRKDIKCLDASGQHSATRLERHDEQLADHDREIERLRGQSTFWNGANSILAVLAGIVGWNR